MAILVGFLIPRLKAQNVHTYLNPNEDNGYVAWLKGESLAEENVNSWKFELFENNNGAPGSLLLSRTLTDNFTQLPTMYLGGDYIYQVTAQASSGDYTGDVVYACPGCGADKLKDWVCNSTNYAYSIRLFERTSGGWYYSLRDATIDLNGISVPYFRYMTQNEYTSWLNDIGNLESTYEHFHVNSSYGQYLNSAGLVITGDVYAVEKKKEQFGFAPFTTDVLVTMPVYTSMSLGQAIQQFNLHETYVANKQRPNLSCQTSLGAITGIAASNPDLGAVVTVILRNKQYQPLGIEDSIISEANINTKIWNTIRELNSEIVDTIGLPPNGDLFYFSNISLARVDTTGFDTTFLPEQIYLENGLINYPELMMEDGLYRITLQFDKDVFISNLFEFRQDYNYSYQSTISDSVEYVVYPNPVTGNIVTVNLSTHRALEVQLQVIGQDAVIRDQTDIISTEDLGQEFTLDISDYGLSRNQYFILKILFSDGSSKSETVLLNNN